MMIAKIIVQNISHNFSVHNTGNELKIIDDMSFKVNDGEILSIIGPSGCGKTTLLRIICGLLIPTSGTVLVDSQNVTGRLTDRILLFQDLLLFDWLTVSKNIAFSQEAKNGEVNLHETNEVLKLVGLDGFDNYYPKELSGGMKQRLALARALAVQPSILLLDEPFSSLDFSSKLELETRFLLLHKLKKFTSIIVTHDIRQALHLSTKILIISGRPSRVVDIIDTTYLGEKNEEMWQHNSFHELEIRLAKTLK